MKTLRLSVTSLFTAFILLASANAIAAPTLRGRGGMPERIVARTARQAALSFARAHYGRRAKVSVARRPLLQSTTPGSRSLTAFGVTLDGKRVNKAVLVRTGFGGLWSPTGVADVHKVRNPKGHAEITRLLRGTLDNAMILRVGGKDTAIEPHANGVKIAEGRSPGGRVLSTVIEPVRLEVIPGAAGIWAGRTPATTVTTNVSGRHGTASYAKDFFQMKDLQR